MSSSHTSEATKFEALPLLTINDDGEYLSTNIKLNIKNLQKIFLDPRVSNSKVMIMSIYGAHKTGKSFLMNYCIRYFRKKRIESLISNMDPLKGFEWGTIKKVQTGGIYIWSEPYFTETITKSKVAVLLLDCQGPFENKSSIREIIAIYAFCNLLSSLQIYNLFNQMTEINLQWAALTSDYCHFFETKSDEKSDNSQIHGQSLFFLLRDWSYSYEYFYGAAGGQQYINKFLSMQQKNLSPESIQLRHFFVSQYKDINCFLMPHIGLEVATSETFCGKWDSLSADFQDHLHNLMKNLFSPNNIIAKEIGDQTVTGRQMCDIAERYYKEIMILEYPKPSTIFNASAKSHHYKLIYECLEFYSEKMKSRHLYSKNANVLLGFHNNCKIMTLQRYDDEIKFGNILFSERFREKLKNEMDDEFLRFYAFHPVEPVMVNVMLSVIIITVILLTIISAIKTTGEFFNINFFLKEIDDFVFTSVVVLVIYCLGSFKKLYSRLNINTEMQIALRNQF